MLFQGLKQGGAGVAKCAAEQYKVDRLNSWISFDNSLNSTFTQAEAVSLRQTITEMITAMQDAQARASS